MTLAEIMVGAALSTILAGAIFSSSSALTKTYNAADHYATAESAQARLADYLDVDLRRATAYSTSKTSTLTNIDVTVPGLYNSSGTPRTPTISGRSANYGTASEQVSVNYLHDKNAGTIVRTETRPVTGGTSQIIRTVIARDVQDFDPTPILVDSTVTVEITFIPRFSWTLASRNNAKAGTKFINKTFLRNISVRK